VRRPGSHIVHVFSKAEIGAFIRDRSDLFARAAADNPFASVEWLDAFVNHVADARWQFVVPEHFDKGQSLMLLYRPFPGASSLRGLSNYYASLYTPLVSSSPDRRAAASELISQVARWRPRVDSVTLEPLQSECADLLEARDCFGRRDWYARRYFCFGNWTLPCADLTFENYMATRPSVLRNTLTRKARKFEKGGGRLELVTSTSGLDRALEAYWTVYNKSWKQREPYPQFISQWAHNCASSDRLRLGIAWWQEQPIAAQFWFVMNRRAYIFKLAYDESFAALSAGTVLTGFMIRHALESDRVLEIDYLTGDDEYKRTWMTSRRIREGVLACNIRTVKGSVLAAREACAVSIRRLTRRARPAERAAGT